MFVARIDGDAVATIAHPAFKGTKLALCQAVDVDGNDEGPIVVAVDPLHAGLHEQVVITTDGRTIRERYGAHAPIRYLVTEIVTKMTKTG
jgi:microcompartment protein CcmK/EutM